MKKSDSPKNKSGSPSSVRLTQAQQDAELERAAKQEKEKKERAKANQSQLTVTPPKTASSKDRGDLSENGDKARRQPYTSNASVRNEVLTRMVPSVVIKPVSSSEPTSTAHVNDDKMKAAKAKVSPLPRGSIDQRNLNDLIKFAKRKESATTQKEFGFSQKRESLGKEHKPPSKPEPVIKPGVRKLSAEQTKPPNVLHPEPDKGRKHSLIPELGAVRQSPAPAVKPTPIATHPQVQEKPQIQKPPAIPVKAPEAQKPPMNVAERKPEIKKSPLKVVEESQERYMEDELASKFLKKWEQKTLGGKSGREKRLLNRVLERMKASDKDDLLDMRKLGLPDQKRLLKPLLPAEPASFDFGGFMMEYDSPVLRGQCPVNMQDRYRAVNSAESKCLAGIDMGGLASKTEAAAKMRKEKLAAREKRLEQFRQVAVDDEHFRYLKALTNDQTVTMPLTILQVMCQDVVPIFEQIYRYYAKCLGPDHRCTREAGHHYIKMKNRLDMYNCL